MWREAGFLGATGEPGPQAQQLVEGGFRRARLDRPPQRALYANQQGGFRVFCPDCGANLTADFVPAHAALRNGRERPVACRSCGLASELDALDFQPPAAFGEAAIVLSHAGRGELVAAALADAQARIGPLRVIARRVSPG